MNNAAPPSSASSKDSGSRLQAITEDEEQENEGEDEDEGNPNGTGKEDAVEKDEDNGVIARICAMMAPYHGVDRHSALSARRRIKNSGAGTIERREGTDDGNGDERESLGPIEDDSDYLRFLDILRRRDAAEKGERMDEEGLEKKNGEEEGKEGGDQHSATTATSSSSASSSFLDAVVAEASAKPETGRAEGEIKVTFNPEDFMSPLALEMREELRLEELEKERERERQRRQRALKSRRSKKKAESGGASGKNKRKAAGKGSRKKRGGKSKGRGDSSNDNAKGAAKGSGPTTAASGEWQEVKSRKKVLKRR